MNVQQALLERLIDYAGLYWPAQLSIPEAVDEYRTIARGPHAWILGRFVVNATRLEELDACIGDGPPLPLAVILDTSPIEEGWRDNLATVIDLVCKRKAPSPIEMLEVALPLPPSRVASFRPTLETVAEKITQAKLERYAVFVELRHFERMFDLIPEAMAFLSEHGLLAKIRCGGNGREAYPSIDEVEAFLTSAHRHHVPFKATQGLHHAVGGWDREIGVETTGFMNLLFASALLMRGDTRGSVRNVLAEVGTDAFAVQDGNLTHRSAQGDHQSLSPDQIARMRRHGMRSFGSCSFTEPIEDLLQMGILAPATV